MYHCHIQFYFIGQQRELWKVIQEQPPLERCTYAFTESDRPLDSLTHEADVIIADLRGLNSAQTVKFISKNMKPDADFIVLTEEAEPLTAVPAIWDIWTPPFTVPMIRYRFRRWQEDRKRELDHWETSQFLDTIINSSPNLIWFKDKDGIHQKVNDVFCRAANGSRENLEGQTHTVIWGVDEDSSDCLKSEREAMEKRETCRNEETFYTRDGIRMLTTYKTPLFDLDGSVMGTVAIGNDTTRERAYEEEILEKNRMMDMLFTSLVCGVMCHSTDGKQLLSVNQAALRLLGYRSQEELLEDGFDAVAGSVLEEDKQKLRDSISSLKKPGESVGVEYRVQHKDGQLFHILGNVKLLEREGHQYIQRFLLDFTKHKLQEAEKDQEIEYQEQMFALFSNFLADNIDDVYILLDKDGKKAEFVSSNAERVLGVPCETLMEDIKKAGRAKYLGEETVDFEALANMKPGMPLKTMETERINPSTGEHRYFRESIYCVSIQNVKKIIVYISDRTQERQSQNTLREALEMAQVASRAKSTFLSSVSHDIRTPMNAIMGFLTLLREESGHKDRVLEYTQKISAASEHLLGLINDVLDMNKIESGSTVLSIGELNLAEIIEEINTIIRPQARAKDQTFDIYTDSLTREQLLGDKLRINQILINILSNAVKYTQKGGTIQMRVQELPQVDENYSCVRFTIRDNGQGMSEDYLRVIFDPFTREQNSMLNKIQGTGLGMAITKSLVDLMNGRISVESKIGEGSTFVVELELRVQEMEDDPKFWERHSIARMIVADDDEFTCQDIVRKMTPLGVETDYTTHGGNAVDMIRSAREAGRPYDLILLDWKMPDLDGLETARLIRKNYSQKIPILLFTAYDWAEIKEEAKGVGIEHFMPKPFFMCNFKESIRRMMGTQKKRKAITDGANVVTGKRIMVVDDIEVNRMILVKILSAMGAVCDTANDGQEAVEKFEASGKDEYDIILMDIQMPRLNGYEATKAIRAGKHPSAQSVAIIAMTANAFLDDIREALEAGMDAHVSKPVVLDQLKKTIHEVMEQKKQLRSMS